MTKDFLHSKNFKRVLWVVGIAIVASFIFHAGMFVGYHKASFSYRWGDNFHRTFGRPDHHFGNQKSFGADFVRNGFTEGYGVAGKVIRVELPTVIVLGSDGVEKIVRVGDTTAIRHFRDTVKASDLRVDDFVTVIGAPNQASEIEAKFIRVMSEPSVIPEVKN